MKMYRGTLLYCYRPVIYQVKLTVLLSSMAGKVLKKRAISFSRFLSHSIAASSDKVEQYFLAWKLRQGYLHKMLKYLDFMVSIHVKVTSSCLSQNQKYRSTQ